MGVSPWGSTYAREANSMKRENQDDIEYEINVLQGIVATPCMFVPRMTDHGMREAIVTMIEWYLSGDLSLRDLVFVAEVMQLFKGMRKADFSDMLFSLESLSRYQDEPNAAKEKIYDTFLFVLQNLKNELLKEPLSLK
jgi:hypothetical protein